ncbi:sigma-70 family RNA polymerase sigma factor [Pedobacter sp. HMF7056]|uniref:Sigma-70 family RNA polymerase sigma factor n=1 Tax=Hufsiella ginkgonis TaxID=2695274 RepID=A0A7K1Y1F9_9SPHI|nr:sigma-70 family RNA polymerase sigma factor [Hufsiella ginkgonis]
MNDAELWTLIISDDYRAFTVLFERHWLRLYKTALRYTKDHAACDEVVHDLFVNIWEKRKHLVVLDFERYLVAATRYQVYTYLKRCKRSALEYREDVSLLKQSITLSAINTGQEKMLYHDLESAIDDKLKLLPKRCQEIFFLSRKEHLSNKEIAERLSISKRSVENQITVALKYLRVCLKNTA